ncbi:MAG: hypothetical protein QXS79_05990 [Candidatus Bathyarchaeia archaeon]
MLSLLGSEKVQRVLRALKGMDIDVIEPKVEFRDAVRYPAFNNTVGSAKDIRESLHLLCEAGVLSSEVVDNIAICPHCQSHRLMIRYQCPSCGSSRLVRGRMIEHLACGHIDFEDKFRSGEGLLCLNCRKPLGQLGVDYRVFSSLYRCLSCKSAFSDPKVEYLCSSGHVFGENDLVVYSVMAFKVNPEKRVLIERLTFDIEVILKPIRDVGLTVKAPVTLYGRSGIKHDFSFAVWHSDDAPPIIVGSLYLSDKAASAADVMALWAKATDVGILHKIMVTPSGIDEGSRDLAETYNMKVVEGKDLQEIAAKVKDCVMRMIEESAREKQPSS